MVKNGWITAQRSPQNRLFITDLDVPPDEKIEEFLVFP